MKNITKVLSSSLLLAVFLTPVLFLSANEDNDDREEQRPPHAPWVMPWTKPAERMEINEKRIEDRIASTTSTTTREKLEKREEKMEKMEERFASSTASTTKWEKFGMFNRQLKNRGEFLREMKGDLITKEFRIIALLENISDRIGERIDLLEDKGVVLTDAKASQAAADAKIAEAKAEAEVLKNLIDEEEANTATSTDNGNEVSTEIKESREKVKTLTKEAYALLQETIKNVKLALPKSVQATSTNNN